MSDPGSGDRSKDRTQAPEGAPAELQAELAAVKEQLLRALAEQQNIRKRAQRELQEALKFAGGDLAGELLAIADNLRRAIESAPPQDVDQGAIGKWREGVLAIERGLTDVFQRHGIRRFDPLGEAFDPQRHHALFRIHDESKAPDTVIQVVQPGYMHHDRLLRPAMVGVSSASPPSSGVDREESARTGSS